MTYHKLTAWGKWLALAAACCLLAPASAPAFQLTPPKNIVHKQVLPIPQLHFIRTKEGITYLISQDGRYVFQGALFDVWNGEQIESMPELKYFEDRVDFNYIGVDQTKMFTLDLGQGSKDVFIFADPNCGVCHELLKAVMTSKQIQADYRIRTVVAPVLGKKSEGKAEKLALMAKENPEKAIQALIENQYDDHSAPATPDPGLQYNTLLTRALNIRAVPYIINSQGLVHKGMPEELQLFLLKK